MPRTKRQAARRRARLESLRTRFRELVENSEDAQDLSSWAEANETIIDFLLEVHASEFGVWAVTSELLRELDNHSPDFAEMLRAIIASVVAPRLAALTPGSTRRRYKYARA